MKHRHQLRPFLLTALALSLVFSSVSARAQSDDSAMAQSLFDQAKQLMASGHFAEACPKLAESQRLDPSSGTLINLARCYEQTGRLASAWTKYLEAARAAKASNNLQREATARERAAALAPRVDKLVITVAPALKSLAGLEIRRDGIVVGEPAWGVALPSDSGEHQVVAKAPGYAPFQVKATVAGEGQTAVVTVPELVPLASASAKPAAAAPERRARENSDKIAPTEPSSRPGLGTARTAALIAGGVGIVGVGLGTAFGLISKSKHDEAGKYCEGTACTDQLGVTAEQAAQRNGNLSTVMMIIGGVGLATGITLWVSAPPRTSSTPSAQVGLGLGVLAVKGAF
jgi:serine/threonine-protein kinase